MEKMGLLDPKVLLDLPDLKELQDQLDLLGLLVVGAVQM
jgi:hypothetical protein